MEKARSCLSPTVRSLSQGQAQQAEETGSGVKPEPGGLERGGCPVSLTLHAILVLLKINMDEEITVLQPNGKGENRAPCAHIY